MHDGLRNAGLVRANVGGCEKDLGDGEAFGAECHADFVVDGRAKVFRFLFLASAGEWIVGTGKAAGYAEAVWEDIIDQSGGSLIDMWRR